MRKLFPALIALPLLAALFARDVVRSQAGETKAPAAQPVPTTGAQR